LNLIVKVGHEGIDDMNIADHDCHMVFDILLVCSMNDNLVYWYCSATLVTVVFTTQISKLTLFRSNSLGYQLFSYYEFNGHGLLHSDSFSNQY